MARYPDEILVKIVQKCIEPYSVWVNVKNFKHPDQSPYRLTYHGLPRVSKVLLVSNMFYKEALVAAQEKFDGTLTIDFAQKPHYMERLEDQLFNVSARLGELRNLVMLVSARYSASIFNLLHRLGPFFAPEIFPRLQQVVVTMIETPFWPNPGQGHTDQLSIVIGEWSRHIHNHLEVGETNEAIQARKIKLLINILYAKAFCEAIAAIVFEVSPRESDETPEFIVKKQFALPRAGPDKLLEEGRIFW